MSSFFEIQFINLLFAICMELLILCVNHPTLALALDLALAGSDVM